MAIGSLFDGLQGHSLLPLPKHIPNGIEQCNLDWYAVRLPVCDGALMEIMKGLGYNEICKEKVLRARTANGAVRLHITREYGLGRGELIYRVTRKLEDFSDFDIGKYASLVPEVHSEDGKALSDSDMRLARQMGLAQEIALNEGGRPENYFKFASRTTKGIRL